MFPTFVKPSEATHMDNETTFGDDDEPTDDSNIPTNVERGLVRVNYTDEDLSNADDDGDMMLNVLSWTD